MHLLVDSLTHLPLSSLLVMLVVHIVEWFCRWNGERSSGITPFLQQTYRFRSFHLSECTSYTCAFINNIQAYNSSMYNVHHFTGMIAVRVYVCVYAYMYGCRSASSLPCRISLTSGLRRLCREAGLLCAVDILRCPRAGRTVLRCQNQRLPRSVRVEEFWRGHLDCLLVRFYAPKL